MMTTTRTRAAATAPRLGKQGPSQPARGLARRLAGALLLVTLVPGFAADAAAPSAAPSKSASDPVTADGGLYFWAVNEGGARIYRPDLQACLRIRGLSAQYADAISGKFQVPAYTLKIVEVRPPEGNTECRLVIDTPAGARECRLGSVMKTFGGSFLAHTYAQDADGSVRYVAGDCR